MRYPFTWGSAEEVVGAQARPGAHAAAWARRPLAGVLPRLGIRQASFSVPASVEESLAQVERVARLVGHPERGAR